MHPALTRCPVCRNELTVTRLHCSSCDTVVEGRFTAGHFANLTAEQLDFILTFVRVEGRLNRMETELGLSYPTIRNRLHEIIRALGYEPGKDEPAPEMSDEKRRSVLEELDAGKISAEDAMRLLRGEEN
ncbi:MAG: hypothetical protein JETCAE02_13550 [Anaerolineaceae bacterium]|nr:DUF2089 domain-containing protein [Anaerolineae bacterium]MBV6464911.1 hypothetical protein [Anaerolineales bacterium]MCE7904356.1 DUF2089 domain-containing protein [Anaerolineae bacterium CFX3]MDL1925443.1 DUF2089 domain-containing protein [Anaerolineae bacterium AMX1]OQY81233.1 MAG: hypothetical protein B6D40_11375 [Anaerolineae bacterium UTCFX3]GER79370.1 conserved hypothetical protein [Candidatus Denitrolinea symbiosum]GIK09954.1 MAG: hypothetical protein BroJett001_20200 [Chloroflexot